VALLSPPPCGLFVSDSDPDGTYSAPRACRRLQRKSPSLSLQKRSLPLLRLPKHSAESCSTPNLRWRLRILSSLGCDEYGAASLCSLHTLKSWYRCSQAGAPPLSLRFLETQGGDFDDEAFATSSVSTFAGASDNCALSGSVTSR